MQRFPVASIAPDVRFGLVDAFASSPAERRFGGPVLAVAGQLQTLDVPGYLRYGDRDAEVLADRFELVDVERELVRRIGVLAESGPVDDLSLAVIALDAADHCFREAGLWRGNIYLAGAQALAAVLEVAGVDAVGGRDPRIVIRELAALELAYLFPVAGKFRAGRYDGQVQFRLNGWGRSLALRLVAGNAGATLARDLRRGIDGHLAAGRARYESFLRELDVARQEYRGDVLDLALGLPIPVLV